MKRKNYLEVDYDAQYEKTQEGEDDWISSVLGSEDDTISGVMYATLQN